EAMFEEELERLGRELPTDDELARAKALIETEELGALQRVEERADRLSMYATLFDEPELINRMLARYLSVTAEQIRDVSALVFRNGAGDEPGDWGGATLLAARALSEGTERYDAIALIEAAERLGASLHADASWDATSVAVDVPGERLGPALELLAEMAHRPIF